MLQIALLAAAAWLACVHNSTGSENPKPPQPMKDILSADLIPEIFGTDAFLVVQIAKSNLEPLPGSVPAMEVGTIVFQVLETLRAGPVPAIATIETPAHRVMDPVRRAKSNQDQWNNLNLNPGANLILSCRPLDPPAQWKATAAVAVTGPRDPMVAAVRRAIEIEAGAPDRREEMLRDALEDPHEFVRLYGVESLSRSSNISKKTGAMLIGGAIRSGKLDPAARLELGRRLTDFFDKTTGAGGSNPAVLTGLCDGLLSAPGAEQQVEWARLISSCFMVEFDPDPAANRAIRNHLRSELPPGIADRTGDALAALPVGSLPEDLREILRQLIEAWRTNS